MVATIRVLIIEIIIVIIVIRVIIIIRMIIKIKTIIIILIILTIILIIIIVISKLRKPRLQGSKQGIGGFVHGGRGQAVRAAIGHWL